MTSQIRISGEVFTREEAQANQRAQVFIELARENNTRIECLCHGDTAPLPLYSRRVGSQYVLCRMPETGLGHSPDCVFYGETSHSTNTTGQIERVDAIEEDDAGISHIRLSVPLTIRQPADRKKSAAPQPNSPRSPAYAAVDELGLLRYLWHCARFNRWYPSMLGKRGWTTVAYHLGKVASQMEVSGLSLSHRLLVAPGRIDHSSVLADFTNEERIQANTDLFFVIGLVKRVDASHGQSYIALQNLRERLWFTEDVWRLCRPRWEGVEQATQPIDGQCVVIAGVTVNERGFLRARYANFLAVSRDFVPFVSPWEGQLVSHLANQQRAFMVRLTPDDTTAGLALLDTASRYERLSIIPQGGVSYGDTARWVWDQNMASTIPELPPAISATGPKVGG
ncbi:MAG: DUF1173 family protein [Rhodocyclaceae bacterium]|nr:DUF1173 family protein [Rhodocyclaceae bacterium]